MAKKTVIKASVNGKKEKRGVLKAVAKLEGINELSVDVEKGTPTMIGNVNSVCIITCLRKKCGRCMEIDAVGLPKSPEKPKPKCLSLCRLPPGPLCQLPPCPSCRAYPYSSCGECNTNTCTIL